MQFRGGGGENKERYMVTAIRATVVGWLIQKSIA